MESCLIGIDTSIPHLRIFNKKTLLLQVVNVYKIYHHLYRRFEYGHFHSKHRLFNFSTMYKSSPMQYLQLVHIKHTFDCIVISQDKGWEAFCTIFSENLKLNEMT